MMEVGQPVHNIFGQVCAVSTGATRAQMRRFIRLCWHRDVLNTVLASYRELFLYGMADEGREAFLSTLERTYLPGEIKELP